MYIFTVSVDLEVLSSLSHGYSGVPGFFKQNRDGGHGSRTDLERFCAVASDHFVDSRASVKVWGISALQFMSHGAKSVLYTLCKKSSEKHIF